MLPNKLNRDCKPLPKTIETGLSGFRNRMVVGTDSSQERHRASTRCLDGGEA
jgi:hypothetical protein